MFRKAHHYVMSTFWNFV